MDNVSRSERSRNAIIQAALAIIARDGPSRLTLDAIARESGMSKGGLMHQFPTKHAVLKALLDLQREHFEEFSRRYAAKVGTKKSKIALATEIATMREATTTPQSIAFAILGAMGQDPSLMAVNRERSATKVEAIKAEADDPDLALLRWTAARGLVLATLFGMCPLSEKDRERLFERLLDDEQWSAPAKPVKRSRNPVNPSKVNRSEASRPGVKRAR